MSGENMSIFQNTLWPETVRAPMRRLVLGIFLAPLLVAALLVGAAYAIAGMTEPTRDGVMAVTANAAMAILPLLYIFTLTFGIAGVAFLWWLAQRGLVTWLCTGAVLGVVAGLLFSEIFMDTTERGLLLSSSVVGIVLFGLIRLISGVAAGPNGQPS